MQALPARLAEVFAVLTTSGQRKQYWQQIAYVKQQPFFMYDTLLANITLNGRQYHVQCLQYAFKHKLHNIN